MSKFQELINSDKPTLVDFYADWCGPCKSIALILVELKDHFKGSVSVIKIGIDKNPAVAQKLRVKGVPNLILFKNGKVQWQHAGVIPKSQLIEMINPNL